MTTIDPAKIRPLNDHVLIRRDDFDEMTKGGLVIPDIAKTAAQGSRQQLKRGRGTVLAVGPGVRGRELRKREGEVVGFRDTGERVPVDLKPGDRVAFDILADMGDLDELGHPMLTLVREDRICGVLEDDADV
jgi:chaperonin GroES